MHRKVLGGDLTPQRTIEIEFLASTLLSAPLSCRFPAVFSISPKLLTGTLSLGHWAPSSAELQSSVPALVFVVLCSMGLRVGNGDVP